MIDFKVEEKDGIPVVRLPERLDALVSPNLEKYISTLTSNRIILDFSEVDYFSSAGMRVLLSYTKKLKSQHGALHCCYVGEEVMEVIKIAGFEKIFHIFPTEAEARAAFSRLDAN